jgi:carboxymethylenebutenolidase
MQVRDYLRDELLEEAGLGYLTKDELAYRLSIFDGNVGQLSPLAHKIRDDEQGPTSPLSVAEDDVSIFREDRSTSTPVGPLDIYVTRPIERGERPGVLLIHDRQGLTPHNRDVARRLAKLGYVVVAPDLLTPAGGVRSFAGSADRIAALAAIDRESMVTQLLCGVEELANMEEVDADRLGCIGFCFGGGMAWLVAVHEPRLKAAVPFYGRIPSLDLVPKIYAAILGIYGALDTQITEMATVIEPVMAAEGKSFEKEIYAGAEHAFHNDTYADRYNPEAAALAWSRATAFLSVHLRN